MFKFVDEKSPDGATANDNCSGIEMTKKFEDTSRIFAESRTEHTVIMVARCEISCL